jgi:hypothetical protein
VLKAGEFAVDVHRDEDFRARITTNRVGSTAATRTAGPARRDGPVALANRDRRWRKTLEIFGSKAAELVDRVVSVNGTRVRDRDYLHHTSAFYGDAPSAAARDDCWVYETTLPHRRNRLTA